jgi:hypothetical protein
VKTLRGLKGPTRLILVLRLVAIGIPTAKAQLQPNDFDVPDGKIETAAGNRLMVSTKEMRATLKSPTRQNVTVKLASLSSMASPWPCPLRHH